MKYAHCYCLVVVSLLLISCGGLIVQHPSQRRDPLSELLEVVIKLQPDKLLKIHTLDANVVIGNYREYKNDTLYVKTDLMDTGVAAKDIFELWERGRGTKKGMIKGAKVLFIVGTVIGFVAYAFDRFGDDSDDSEREGAKAGVIVWGGGAIGAIGGGLIGAGIGSAFDAWYRIYRRGDAK